MSESNYLGASSKVAAGVDYTSQQAPHRRNRADGDRWAQIALENAVMARKLRDIRREPPANFHAPKGYQSVRGGQRTQQQRAGKARNEMPETLHYVPPTPWPPTEPAHQNGRQSKAQQEIAARNSYMASKLREIYRHNDDSLLEKHKLGRGFDCNDRWALRTALYDGGSPSTASGADSSGGKVPDLEQASVPKSLGMARCSGCGVRCFYAADGVRLMRCRGCKSVWYCSDACAKLDYQSHKALCKYTTTGLWKGVRPAEDCWVSNAAMAEVRSELRRRAGTLTQPHTTSSPSNPTAPASPDAGSADATSPDAADASPTDFADGFGTGQSVDSPAPDSVPDPSPEAMQPQRPAPAWATSRQRGVPEHQRRRHPPVPQRPGSAASGQRKSLTPRAGGVPAADAEALTGEVEVVRALEEKYQRLRERELEAERELADVEFRANNGLDGPRPCMYVMKRFAGGAGKEKAGRRPSSAGPRTRGGREAAGNGDKAGAGGAGRKPAWQDLVRFL